MSECTHDCSTCGQNCGQRTEPESLLQKPHEQSHIKKVIGVVQRQGRRGQIHGHVSAGRHHAAHGPEGAAFWTRTSPARPFPREFGLKQKAEGNDTGIFPVRTTTGIDVMSLNLLLPNDSDPVAWRGPIIAGAVTQFWTDVIWGDKDVLFVDMPPGTGDVPLTVFQSIPVDAAIAGRPRPQELVGMIVEKAVKMAEMMNIPILGLVENMSYVALPGLRQEDRRLRREPCGRDRQAVRHSSHRRPAHRPQAGRQRGQGHDRADQRRLAG